MGRTGGLSLLFKTSNTSQMSVPAERLQTGELLSTPHLLQHTEFGNYRWATPVAAKSCLLIISFKVGNLISVVDTDFKEKRFFKKTPNQTTPKPLDLFNSHTNIFYALTAQSLSFSSTVALFSLSSILKSCIKCHSISFYS